MTWKPQGYTSLAPYLMVADAEATLRFAEAAFDAARLRIIPRADGGIMHAEVRVDDTVLMMGEVPETVPANLHVYVRDAQAAFQRALAAGGQQVQALADKGDGDLRGGVADPNGIVWWIASELAP